MGLFQVGVNTGSMFLQERPTYISHNEAFGCASVNPNQTGFDLKSIESKMGRSCLQLANLYTLLVFSTFDHVYTTATAFLQQT